MFVLCSARGKVISTSPPSHMCKAATLRMQQSESIVKCEADMVRR